MNSEAGTPFPATSAMTKPIFVGERTKKSNKSPPIMREGMALPYISTWGFFLTKSKLCGIIAS
jgi:hypothetical protein